MASFIGRKRELAALWDQLRTAAEGRLAVAMVTGEPGIGKTRLLAEMEAQAAGMGVATLRGGAFEAEGMPPYLPFLEALGRHVQAMPADPLREQVGPAASILATILPELTVRFGDLPPGYSLPADQARLRLFQAIAAFLAAIAQPTEAGLLLILDDLHWADSASLDLLWQIPRYQPAGRLLVLGAYRPGDLAQNPTLERALYELNRQRLLTTLVLSPLNAGEMAALAANCLAGPADPALVALLYTQSEGNPFFAEELLQDWQEAGALVQATAPPHAWTLVRSPGEALPPSIISAIRQRLTRLPTPVVDPLRVAAIIGRTFGAALLAQITGQEVEEVEAHLQTAAQAGLVRSEGRGVFTFGHDVIRDCLSTEVSRARRQRLHRSIGLALESARPPAGPGRAGVPFCPQRRSAARD